ncbi:unnamed protein product, partial [marine sediment metagenome]
LQKDAMHQATREKRKTVTRRLSGKGMDIINANPNDWCLANDFPQGMIYHNTTQFQWDTEGKMCTVNSRYHVGQEVYIKEAWRDTEMGNIGGQPYDTTAVIEYKDHAYKNVDDTLDPDWWESHSHFVWRSPLFMPAWAARTFIKITDVRPERLQEITWDDTHKEGILRFDRDNPDPTNGGMGYNRGATGLPMRYESIAAYMDLWDSINAKRGYSWESNPWVFRYEYILLEAK